MVIKDSRIEEKGTIGKMVRDRRKEMGATQALTAKKTGLSRSYIADIEKGRYAPSVKALMKLAKFLELDLNSLLA